MILSNLRAVIVAFVELSARVSLNCSSPYGTVMVQLPATLICVGPDRTVTVSNIECVAVLIVAFRHPES